MAPSLRLDRKAFFYALNSVIVGLCLCAGCQKPPPPPPNIVLISIDSLRADHLSCYGYSKPTTPNIDRFAQHATRFEQMTSSSSWTLPAHAAMLTGLVDSVHGATDNGWKLDPSRKTLGTILSAAGYTTAGFFSGPYLHPSYGLSQGFATYVDCSSVGELAQEALETAGEVGTRAVNDASHEDITNPRLTEQVTRWLGQAPHQPFFLFVHMWDVHYDYIPPPPYDRKFDPDYTGNIDPHNYDTGQHVTYKTPARDLQHIVALYDGEIAWTDEHVGKILAELERRNLSQNTLVVITADHGDAFFEHGSKGHRNTLYEEVTHIPLLIHDPRVEDQSRTCATQARMIDIAPTILDSAGVPISREMMGQTLRPALRGEALERDEAALSELDVNPLRLRSYRRPNRKLIVDNLNQHMVFDLVKDPLERTAIQNAQDPVYLATQDDQSQVRAWLEAWLLKVPLIQNKTTAPARVNRALQSLGYAGQEPPAPKSNPSAPFQPAAAGE